MGGVIGLSLLCTPESSYLRVVVLAELSAELVNKWRRLPLSCDWVESVMAGACFSMGHESLGSDS